MNGSAGRQIAVEGLVFGHLSMDSRGVTVHASTSDDAPARCPVCQRPSSRAHSRYARTVHDLPWRGVGVAVRARARRFFCDNEGCERAIFCERLPEIAAHARKTNRLEEALLAIVLELGGRAGARLAAELRLLGTPGRYDAGGR